MDVFPQLGMSPSQPFQLSLFDTDLLQDRLPKKPYCSNDLASGLIIRSRESALRHRFIQVNPPHLRFWMVFDIDRQGAAFAWEEAKLPSPQWTSINPENAHAHSAWGIDTPVPTSDCSRRDPIRYLCAIEAAYRESLMADIGYSGLITKNPVNESWRTIWGRRELYQLGELAEYVDLRKFLPKSKPEEIGLGRNVTLFDSVRHWAYANIRYFDGKEGFNTWINAVHKQAIQRNGDFRYPLDSQEVLHLTNSIAKWVWKHFDWRDSDKRFSALQAYRGSSGGKKGTKTAKSIAGRISGSTRRESAKNKLNNALNELILSGKKPSITAIAKLAGISRQKVYTAHADFIAQVQKCHLNKP